MAKLQALKENGKEVCLPRSNAGPISRHFLTDIVWFNAVGFLLLHIAGVVGIYASVFCAKPRTVYWALVLLFLTGQSVGVGAHRLYAHRAYKATWLLRLALVILFTAAGQNCMYVWVRDHRQHHRYSDTHADPHNAQRGLFFSHIGWLMMKKHPQVIEKGRTVDMSDVEQDIFVMLQKKWYKLLYVIWSFIIPIGVPVIFFEENVFVSLWVCFFARYLLLLNFTWSINSFAHIYGNRPYHKQIKARDHLLVTTITMGEGWHNFHHCFPFDYRSSELGSVFNICGGVIELLAWLGLAHDLKKASVHMILRRAAQFGDGSHPALESDHRPAPSEITPAATHPTVSTTAQTYCASVDEEGEMNIKNH